MAMIPVRSSNIAAVGYDPATKKARVQFSSGTTYEYAEVPQTAFEALRDAPSVGVHFAREFRLLYAATKVDEEPRAIPVQQGIAEKTLDATTAPTRIFVLSRPRPADPFENDADEAYGFVVRAKSAKSARRLAGEQAGDEGPGAWLDEKRSDCVTLSHDGPEIVLLRDLRD